MGLRLSLYLKYMFLLQVSILKNKNLTSRLSMSCTQVLQAIIHDLNSLMPLMKNLIQKIHSDQKDSDFDSSKKQGKKIAPQEEKKDKPQKDQNFFPKVKKIPYHLELLLYGWSQVKQEVISLMRTTIYVTSIGYIHLPQKFKKLLGSCQN